MALRKFGTLNRAEPEVEDTPHEMGPADEPVLAGSSPEASTPSPAVATKPITDLEQAVLEGWAEVKAKQANTSGDATAGVSGVPHAAGPSVAPTPTADVAATSTLPEDENLGNDEKLARLKPEHRLEYDALSTEAKESYLEAKLAEYDQDKGRPLTQDRRDDLEQGKPRMPPSAADLVIGLASALPIAALNVAAHAGSLAMGAARSGKKAYSERKLRNNIYEAKMNELRQNTGAMLAASEKLGESVSIFNLSFLNSGAAAQIRKAAEAEGIDFMEMMTRIRDGKAKPEHQAMARQALVDPTVSAAWDRVMQDHGAFQNAKAGITENCEMLSKNFANRFDHEAVADNLREAGEVALSKVPDPVYENPDETKLKEKMKEMLEQIQEMVRNLLNRIAEAFRPR